MFLFLFLFVVYIFRVYHSSRYISPLYWQGGLLYCIFVVYIFRVYHSSRYIPPLYWQGGFYWYRQRPVKPDFIQNHSTGKCVCCLVCSMLCAFAHTYVYTYSIMSICCLVYSMLCAFAHTYIYIYSIYIHTVYSMQYAALSTPCYAHLPTHTVYIYNNIPI